MSGSFGSTRGCMPSPPPTLTHSLVRMPTRLRVRVGPLFSDHEAERVLASVSRAGFPDCRLIIE